MDIGFEEADFDIAVTVEFDPSCCDTLKKNRPKTPVIQGDISELDTSHILKVGGLKVLEPGLVIGGLLAKALAWQEKDRVWMSPEED